MSDTQNNFLTKLLAAKQDEIVRHSNAIPIAELLANAEQRDDQRDFYGALASANVNIIAEVKRASPSKGDIRADLDPAALADQYDAGGAAAISVLTEQDFFKGSLADMHAARNACTRPVLRKDFIFTEYQVAEAAANGADALLLIVRILDPVLLTDLLAMTESLGLAALVEVHDEADVEAALAAKASIVGINNRDLQTFAVDLNVAGRIAAMLPPDVLAVAASGISTRDDIDASLALGVSRFLVGESLVRSDDPAAMLRLLRGER
jgi:indole-3-glycerol phosphate synthase